MNRFSILKELKKIYKTAIENNDLSLALKTLSLIQKDPDDLKDQASKYADIDSLVQLLNKLPLETLEAIISKIEKMKM